MRKRIKLKKNKFIIKKRDKCVLIFLLICFITYLFSFSFSEKSSSTVLEYAKNETTLLSTLVINEAIDEYSNEFDDSKDFIFESKDNTGKITSVDFNTININKSLTLINKRILENLKKIERGELTSLNIENSFEFTRNNGNIIYFLPYGLVTNNIFITSLGPKIPLKMNAIGRVVSNIKTEIKHYGINNALLKMYIEVEITQLILLPFISEKVIVKVSVPLVIKIIEGSIPNFYGGLLTSSSPINSLNVE